jgi:nitrogen fixation protein FixH
MSVQAERPFTGRKFLAVLVGSFIVVLAVNCILVWYALSSWTGLVSDSAYEDGLGFDRVLAESKAEAALGWKAAIAYDASGRLTVRLADSKGRPLAGFRLAAQFMRPTSEGHDRSLTLSEVSPGSYGGVLQLPLPGQWDVRVTVSDSRKPRFHAERRILVGL